MGVAVRVIRPCRILFLTKYGFQWASSRYRVYQYIPALERHGFYCEIRPLFSGPMYADRGRLQWLVAFLRALVGLARRIGDVFRCFFFDIIVIQKEIVPRLDGRLLGWLFSVSGHPVIRDFDDADYVVNSRLGDSIAYATLVLAGNEEIAAWARQYCPRVAIVPTVVAIERYDEVYRYRKGSPDSQDKVVKIVWIGTPNTVRYLDSIREALVQVARLRHVMLVVIGAHWDAQGVQTRCVSWSYESEIDLLMSCDIGIMPLTDGAWERGKCGLKLLQYMASRLPVVASNVGVNSEIVRHEIDGFLVNTATEWIQAILTLLDDPQLRNRMGQAAYERVRSRYSLEAYQETYVELIRTCIKGGTGSQCKA